MKVTRRGVLTSSLVMALGGLETVSHAAQATPAKEQCWKYVKLDPQKVGQRAYDCYGDDGCLYGAFKGALLEYADTVAANDPELAASVRAFPFFALRCGRGGFTRLKQLCGAVAGGVMFIGCFVPDFKQQCKLADQLGKFVTLNAMPDFIPQKDAYPDFLKVKSTGPTCREMGGAWMKAASDEQKKFVLERCKRLTASVMAETVRLLNDFYTKK